MGKESFRSAFNRLVEAKRLTHGQLGTRAGYSRGYLWELAKGKKTPKTTTVEDLDVALNAAGALVRAWTTGDDKDTDTAAVVAMGGLWRADPGYQTAGPMLEELAVTAEESARFIRRAGVGLSAEYLAQLAAEVDMLAVDYLRRPPYTVYRQIATLRREVMELLDAHVTPAYLTDLYLAAGRLTALLAHASADLGQPVIAEAHARSAWMAAELAGGHRRLRSYVRWIQSNVAYWRGDYRTAALIARDSRRDAVEGSSLLRLASQEARAAAGSGDAEAARTALHIAQEQREQLGTPTEPGVFWFAPGKAAYYAAEARLALGGQDNARQAVADATDAAARLADEVSPSPELVAAAQLDLAMAHLAGDELDRAAVVLDAVLSLPTERRTAPIADRAARIESVLAARRYAGAAEAAALRERVSIFMAYPAMRGLPTTEAE